LKIVQVIHVQSEENIEQALAIEKEVDAFLLDSGNPNAAQKILGGTGKTHDWELSRKLVDQTTRPVFLAGGLHAGNVREAIERVMPFGVDICSGVRTAGALDEMKLALFFDAVNKTW
jgi:phosphoribosylanthranilate isomerase